MISVQSGQGTCPLRLSAEKKVKLKSILTTGPVYERGVEAEYNSLYQYPPPQTECANVPGPDYMCEISQARVCNYLYVDRRTFVTLGRAMLPLKAIGAGEALQATALRLG